eukprot:Blabericola_migrator_1__4837@NODE_2539_length_2629_cov_351_828259_g648_i4_p2_GENE_NODE_2539_length_2629_cov_351_828259_g648_i4NODE_2539_length_2629_cov_351_828259_g648_i4_p2_ORF_typecomplete_len172_score6_39_NODE_2539_length_2629_cov_351_828259_g648_i485600
MGRLVLLFALRSLGFLIQYGCKTSCHIKAVVFDSNDLMFCDATPLLLVVCPPSPRDLAETSIGKDIETEKQVLGSKWSHTAGSIHRTLEQEGNNSCWQDDGQITILNTRRISCYPPKNWCEQRATSSLLGLRSALQSRKPLSSERLRNRSTVANISRLVSQGFYHMANVVG